MKQTFAILSLALVLACVSPVAHADLDSFLRDVNKLALSDIKSFNNKLSKQFSLPVPDVEAIVKSVPKPEDAFMILQLGQMTHKTPEEVLQKYQRSRGKAWGALAKELGIKPGSPEFHALKRGNLSFTGEAAESTAAHRSFEHEKGKRKGRKNEKDKEWDEENERKRGKKERPR